MRFEEIEVFGFGKLKNNLKIPFAKDINVILAPNDRGKSTLQEAIFALFYPFGDVKSEEGRKKRMRFKPWKAGTYGGVLTFALDRGEKFKIEKLINSSPREDKTGVFKFTRDNWQQVRILKQDKYLGLLTGRYFLGIGRDVFESISIVRQFDIAGLGERRKILDEIRSLIEVGKSGGGLAQSLKKLQDKKNYIGTAEKRGKRTIAGSRQLKLEQLEREIQQLEEHLKRSKSMLHEKKRAEDLLKEKTRKLEEELKPAEERLKKELSQSLFILEEEYRRIPNVVKEMGLQELQNLRTYRDALSEIKIRYENKEENIKKTKKSLRVNTILASIYLFFSVLFFFLSGILDLKLARFIFLIFAFLLLSGAIYFLRVLRLDKKSLIETEKDTGKLLEAFFQRGKNLGILKNSQEKGIQFYEELWALFLKELGVSNLEELEIVWNRTKEINEILNKASKINLVSVKPENNVDVDLEKFSSKIENLNRLISEVEKLEQDILRIKGNIQIFEKTVDIPQEDVITLNTEKLVLEKELETINRYREALELSMEALKKAGEQLYEEVSPYINKFVNKYFNHLSSEYEFVRITPDLQIYLKPREYPEVVSIDNVGKGMQTSLYLFLRLAIISLFTTNRGESLPFILDETLNVLDDFSENRQRKFLELLLEVSPNYNIQCIYFTCQKNGQYLPIKSFLEEKGYTLREEHIEDFVILQGGQ